jgi:hypothetical protein
MKTSSRSSEAQRGNRKDSRTAADVEYAFAVQVERLEPFQAQRGGGVRARAKREARIQAHDRRLIAQRIGLRRHLCVPRHDPERAAEVQRRIVDHPCAHPILVGDVAPPCRAEVGFGRQRFERVQHRVAIGVRIEQRGDGQRLPQRHRTHARFEDRVLVRGGRIGVHERDRQRAEFVERRFDARMVGLRAAQAQFEERHRRFGDAERKARTIAQ